MGAWYLTDGGAGWTSIKLYVNTAASLAGATLLTTVSAANNTTYQKIQGTYVAPATANYYFFIEVIHTSGPTDMSIDDLFAIETPNCIEPNGLTATLTSTTGANFAWNVPSPTPTQYEWAATTSATPPASGDVVTSPAAASTSLTANTTYYLHVRSECAPGVYSAWATSASFTMPTVTAVPWSEPFTTTTTPTGWNTTGWTIGSSAGGGNPTNSLYKNLYSSAATGTFSTLNLGTISSGQVFSFEYALLAPIQSHNISTTSLNGILIAVTGLSQVSK
jgi:hypothetical protein